jgi:hypothetical protein
MLILKRVLLVWFILYFGAISLTQAATDCNAVTEISPAECESLLQLYHSTNGANWHNNEGWNVTNTPCSWKGITCENDGVTKLYLNSNQLTGTIPNFSGLPNLRRLYLYSNQLTGTIPNFSDLPNLQWLYLDSNQLTGTIPNFSALPNLWGLFLDSNQLTGTIPVSSNTLINLEYLDLRNNPLCKKADYDYAIWPIKQSSLDDETTWQAQLETFPICPPPTETGPIPTVLSFIGLKEYYQIGEIVDVEIAVNFTAENPADTVDLWIAIQQPSEDFLYMSALPLADLFSPKPQFFREDLGTTQETFSVISDFKLPKGVGGNYTFYAALVETGKNPLRDGAWVMRHIVQSRTLLSNR